MMAPVPKVYVALGMVPEKDKPLGTALRPWFPHIMEELESVPWTWFTAIRIGYSYIPRDPQELDSQFPAVLLINVKPNTRFNQVPAAAGVIKSRLEQLKTKIHIEIFGTLDWM